MKGQSTLEVCCTEGRREICRGGDRRLPDDVKNGHNAETWVASRHAGALWLLFWGPSRNESCEGVSEQGDQSPIPALTPTSRSVLCLSSLSLSLSTCKMRITGIKTQKRGGGQWRS